MENIAYQYSWMLPSENAWVNNKDLMDLAKAGKFFGKNTLRIDPSGEFTYHIDGGIEADFDTSKLPFNNKSTAEFKMDIKYQPIHLHKEEHVFSK